jgi:hypothetical protein
MAGMFDGYRILDGLSCGLICLCCLFYWFSWKAASQKSYPRKRKNLQNKLQTQEWNHEFGVIL